MGDKGDKGSKGSKATGTGAEGGRGGKRGEGEVGDKEKSHTEERKGADGGGAVVKELEVVGADGSGVEKLKPSGKLFATEPNIAVLEQAIHNERANRRLGTACTKERGYVRGSTRKPWKQKGTGRARAGSVKSPIWRGGGVTFGPLPRDYSYRLPKKVKRLSIVSVLNKRLMEGRLRVAQELNISGKSKEACKVLYDMSLLKKEGGERKGAGLKKSLRGYRLLVITGDENAKLKRSTKNIPWVKYLIYKRLNVLDIFYAHEVLIEKRALEELEKMYK